MARLPSKSETLAAVTLAVAVGQQFGLIQPLEKRAEANKEANYSARDRLGTCEAERIIWQNKYLELIE